jgi:hypothetical protein
MKPTKKEVLTFIVPVVVFLVVVACALIGWIAAEPVYVVK